MLDQQRKASCVKRFRLFLFLLGSRVHRRIRIRYYPVLLSIIFKKQEEEEKNCLPSEEAADNVTQVSHPLLATATSLYSTSRPASRPAVRMYSRRWIKRKRGETGEQAM